MKMRERLRGVNWLGNVIGTHRIRAIARASIGAVRKIQEEAEEGLMGSLMNNFTPSAMGCSKP